MSFKRDVPQVRQGGSQSSLIDVFSADVGDVRVAPLFEESENSICNVTLEPQSRHLDVSDASSAATSCNPDCSTGVTMQLCRQMPAKVLAHVGQANGQRRTPHQGVVFRFPLSREPTRAVSKRET